MDVRSIGLHKIFIAPITDWNNSTMPANNTSSTTNWVDLGDVYQNTAKLTDDDPSITTHKSETSAKKIVLSEPGDCKLELSLMDPTLTELQRLFGGVITTVVIDGQTHYKWTRPRNFQPKAFAYIGVPEDGDATTCPAVAIAPKFEITYSKTGIMLVPMTIYLLGDVSFTPEYSPTRTPLYDAPAFTVSPTSLSFTSAADSTGKTVTASSTGNVTAANVDEGCDWVTAVTYTGKVVTVKVAANANTDARSTTLHIVADGATVDVPITQAGA